MSERITKTPSPTIEGRRYHAAWRLNECDIVRRICRLGSHFGLLLNAHVPVCANLHGQLFRRLRGGSLSSLFAKLIRAHPHMYVLQWYLNYTYIHPNAIWNLCKIIWMTYHISYRITSLSSLIYTHSLISFCCKYRDHHPARLRVPRSLVGWQLHSFDAARHPRR